MITAGRTQPRNPRNPTNPENADALHPRYARRPLRFRDPGARTEGTPDTLAHQSFDAEINAALREGDQVRRELHLCEEDLPHRPAEGRATSRTGSARKAVTFTFGSRANRADHHSVARDSAPAPSVILTDIQIPFLRMVQIVALWTAASAAVWGVLFVVALIIRAVLV